MGAEVLSPSMAVADLGEQAVIKDPNGAIVGLWQPGTFIGFSILGEPGFPSWFELQTSAFEESIEFYESMIGCRKNVVSTTDGVRYATLSDETGEALAGIRSDLSDLPSSAHAAWSVYWNVVAVDQTVDAVQRLGGTVVGQPIENAYGRVATVTDPMGARFRLHAPNR